MTRAGWKFSFPTQNDSGRWGNIWEICLIWYFPQKLSTFFHFSHEPEFEFFFSFPLMKITFFFPGAGGWEICFIWEMKVWCCWKNKRKPPNLVICMCAERIGSSSCVTRGSSFIHLRWRFKNLSSLCCCKPLDPHARGSAGEQWI